MNLKQINHGEHGEILNRCVIVPLNHAVNRVQMKKALAFPVPPVSPVVQKVCSA
jgi:hypothetical protein